MKYLIYVSNAVKAMTEDELEELLEQSRRNNLKHHITGVLLYFEGTFIQVLEGMPEDVDFIYKKIEKDARHKNIIKIVDRPLLERNFPDWTMGFSSLKGAPGDKFVGYIEYEELLDNPSDHRAVTILKTFISTFKVLVCC
jgi:hypothetical protein